MTSLNEQPISRRTAPPVHSKIARILVRLGASFLVVAGIAWGAVSLAWPAVPVQVHVRWQPGVTDSERIALEQRFRLTNGMPTEGATWEYQLADSSTANIRTLVQDARVADTAHLNRRQYRPEFAQDRVRRNLVYSIVIGGVGSLAWLVVGASVRRRMPSPLSLWSDVAGAVRTPRNTVEAGSVPGVGINASRGATAAALLAGIVATVAMSSLAGAAPLSAAGALVSLYAFGYLVGCLLVDRVDREFGPSVAVIRTAAGLLLSSVAFLLSLVLRIPWWAGPGVLLALTLYVNGRRAFAWPHLRVHVSWHALAAGIVAAVLLLPITLSYFFMAPGTFPPVFYNVDTPSVLEKVHVLVAKDSYPPESLSNLGALRTYHYGTHAMAALLSRSSRLLPHQSLFLIVLPLLTIGVLAAAVMAARYIAPNLPRSITVPLLLIATPALSTSLWETLAPQLWNAATARGISIDAWIGDVGLWGILSNESKNVGGDLVVLGTIAGIAAAPVLGWRLPAFLAGTAILVKIPAGVALVAGLMLAEAWQVIRTGRFRPSAIAVLAGAVFVATAAAFFLMSFESAFRLQLFPLYHLREIAGAGALLPWVLDIGWLLLPALLVVPAASGHDDDRTSLFLLMGIAPIVVVNMTNMEHVADTGGGAGDDWLQILHATPFLFHACALSLVSRRWLHIGRFRRAAVLFAMALAVTPAAVAAARYSQLFLRDPQSGHEFADNRSLAQALAVIPTRGSLIVTNDLRYPADHFGRDERQMQISALFGHQAFAVNYAYEVVPSAPERRGLQKLLQQPEWSAAITDAARAHRWTHLLIRKDYAHPARIPLERLFENGDYVVYRFP